MRTRNWKIRFLKKGTISTETTPPPENISEEIGNTYYEDAIKHEEASVVSQSITNFSSNSLTNDVAAVHVTVCGSMNSLLHQVQTALIPVVPGVVPTQLTGSTNSSSKQTTLIPAVPRASNIPTVTTKISAATPHATSATKKLFLFLMRS